MINSLIVTRAGMDTSLEIYRKFKEIDVQRKLV